MGSRDVQTIPLSQGTSGHWQEGEKRMTTRIIINGREITNPLIKALLILVTIMVAAIVTAVVIFVLLPVIGIVVSLSVGFIVIFVIATVVSIAALALMTLISAWLFGASEFRIERIHRRK